MKSLVTLLFFLGVFTEIARATGAGRAFPIDSENLAIKVFTSFNPSIEWDHTNFLIDLSGQYANCKYVNQKTVLTADRKTPEGDAVTVVIDTVQGKESDVNSVNSYIRDLLDRWSNSRQYHSQIMNAKKIGCSVRPSCSGYAVVACVFSGGQDRIVEVRPTPENIVRTPWIPPKPTEKNQFDDANKKPYEKPRALAFTPEQYRTAEEIMSKKWDRAHFLENLSGFETDCSMIGRKDWPFDQTKKIMREERVKIIGQYGHTANRGSTPEALKEILRNFKPVSNAKSIGCSVIPDCIAAGSTMEVVVSCLYEEI